KQYRQQMTGHRLATTVQGPSIATAEIEPTIEGHADEATFAVESLPYIDAAAVHHGDGNIYVSLVNRSPDTGHRVEVAVPSGYAGATVWMLAHADINAPTSEAARTAVDPTVQPIAAKRGKVAVHVPACGLYIVKLVPAR